MIMRTGQALALLVFCCLLAACFGGGGGSGYSSPGDSTPTDPSDPNDPTDPPVDPNAARDRYSFNNQCFALQSLHNEQYLQRSNSGLYSASADSPDSAEAFFFKPAALGEYLLYSSEMTLLTATGNIGDSDIESADTSAVFTLLADGDATQYPAPPEFDQEPSLESLDAYRNFIDPFIKAQAFTFTAQNGRRLAIAANNNLVVEDLSQGDNQLFKPVPTTGCETFPEAQSNVSTEKLTGTPTSFSGTRPDGTVMGHADVHVHIGSSTFLGNAQWGQNYHKLGIPHALADCGERHGPGGILDVVGAFLGNDFDGHATDGWPSFSDWPSRHNLTHEAIYWKWLERAWLGGLRIAVNDLVDNQTLCELASNVSDNSVLATDCNSMNNAKDQIGTMYAMQDYIDAQYGGRGKGFLRISLSPDEARGHIENGQLALVLALEISNTLNCTVKYNPLRTTDAWNETGAGLLGLDNTYGCNTDESGGADPNGDHPLSIRRQLDEIWALGVRKIISVHEFDNAFGGNGIFNGFLNLGNRENTGGIPSDTLSSIVDPLSTGDLGAVAGNLGNAITGLITGDPGGLELATGEFWSTYDCPQEGGLDTPNAAGVSVPFDGYLWDHEGEGGGVLFTNTSLPPSVWPACADDLLSSIIPGQPTRPGGTLPCYPVDKNQCNARWMTPTGVYMYKKMMEYGFLFDFDHFEMEMKSQALDLAEAQPIPYPFVSTHGTFGGIKKSQAMRVFKNGGFLYPSIESSESFTRDMEEAKTVWEQAMTARAQEGLSPFPFAFGYGTDTNGLSEQSEPRDNICSPTNTAADCLPAIVYPFKLFDNDMFQNTDSFQVNRDLAFEQPRVIDVRTGEGRSWHEDVDGNAQYGMFADLVRELQLAGNNEALEFLFSSAEKFLQTWELTYDAAAAIRNSPSGKAADMPEGVLRPAPTYSFPPLP